MNNIQSPRTDDTAIEQEIQAKGKTAPRVTPADVEANIVSEHYFTGRDGAEANDDPDGVGGLRDYPPSLALLTFCVLTLRNGFTVTGESACASPENFDAEIGRKIARQNAVQKIWPLMGYALKERLHEAKEGNPVPAAMRVLREAMRADPEYAWAWHCNVAMSGVDGGAEHEKANRQAAQFMSNAFDVDTSQFEHFKRMFA
jgi:hypothetical protein